MFISTLKINTWWIVFEYFYSFKFKSVNILKLKYLIFLALSQETSCFELNKDYPGNDIASVSGITTIDQCRLACFSQSNCVGFGFYRAGSLCYLKNKAVISNPNPTIYFGFRICNKGKEDILCC